MILTVEQFYRSMKGLSLAKAQEFLPYFNAAIAEFGIATPLRIAHFIGQLSHESCDLKYFAELWGRVPSEAQASYKRRMGNTRPEAIEAARKAGFSDVGKFYKGHGCLQTTGHDNHKRVGDALGIDAVNYPELLEKPEFAFRSAALFWADNHLNQLADTDSVKLVTRRVNGGYNGLAERIVNTAKAKRALGI